MDDLFLPVSDPPLTPAPPPTPPPLQCCYSRLECLHNIHPSKYSVTELPHCQKWVEGVISDIPATLRKWQIVLLVLNHKILAPPPPPQHTSPSLLPHTILLSLSWAQWLTELETAIWGHASAVSLHPFPLWPVSPLAFVYLSLYFSILGCSAATFWVGWGWGGDWGVGGGWGGGVGGCNAGMQGMACQLANARPTSVAPVHINCLTNTVLFQNG